MQKLFFGLLIPLFYAVPVFSQGLTTVGFNTVDHTCVNTPVPIQNTTTGATNYYWSFCAADFSSTPEAVNLGNPGGLLSSPVFGCYAQDDNKNYYGLVASYTDGDLIRLNFGNSLLNNPTAEDLGTFGGAIPNQSEGIQLLRVNGNWTAILVGGGNQAPNSSPRILKIDFGNSLANQPVATNWGNTGGLNLPHDLFITKEAGNYYGFAINVNDNTITRLSFGPDFNNPPVGTNLGNIGNIDYPAGLTFVNYNQNWFAFIANRVTNSLTRLSFGASILNSPIGANIGNPGGSLDYPRDVALFAACDGVYGFVVNETSNDLVKLNFGSDLTAIPQATNLGNTGNLSFPHSISDFFRAGNDIYAFIPNVYNNTLTRIRFAGCQDIPGSTDRNPSPVTYQRPGVYNVNLLVDLGLPTQTSFCRQVTVNPSPEGAFKGDTVCFGNSPVLSFISSAGTPPFSIGFNDGSSDLIQTNLNGYSQVTLPYSLTNTGLTTFTLKTISDANGCKATVNTNSNLLINPVPQGGISGNMACSDDSARILFNASSGLGPFEAELSDGVKTITVKGVQSGKYIYMAPLPFTTSFSLLKLTDKSGCTRATGFTSPDVTLSLHPSPKVQFSIQDPVCYDKAPFLITGGQEISGLAGSGDYSGQGIDPSGNFRPSNAGAGEHNLTYTFTSDVGCSGFASTSIVVNPDPVVQVIPMVTICGGTPVQLVAGGGLAGWTYSWSPAYLLNDASLPDPIARVDTTTTFVVEVKDVNGCASFDTLKINAPVNSKTIFAIPNSFTPNGDGHNDCFGIKHWAQVSLDELAVYNRQGARVFSTKNYSDCWDGTFRGQMQPSGGYVYVIKARSSCGQIIRTGMVLLIR